MTEHHGEFCDYDGMRQVLRRVAEVRNMARSEIDRIGGLPSGWAAKVLAEVPSKRIGPDTLGPIVGTLGVKFIAVDDLEAMARFTARAEERVEYKARKLTDDKHKIIIVKITKRRMKYLSNRATKARKHIPKRKRISIARKAARARWRGNRPIEAKGSPQTTHQQEQT